MAFDLSPYLSSGRSIVTALSGVAFGVGITSIAGVPTGDFVTGFDHIAHGLNEIVVGVTPFVSAAAAGYAFFKNRLTSKVADVHAAAPGDLASAVKTVAPAVLLDAAANVPGTTEIRTTPALAQATASPKVVS